MVFDPESCFQRPRPARTGKLRGSEWEVREITHARALRFVEKHHYARGMGNTSVARYGLFKRSEPRKLRGVAVWTPALQNVGRVACSRAGIEDPECQKRVLNLSRLATDDEVPKNAATFLMGRAMRDLKSTQKRARRWQVLVTFADELQGHTGAIYRAANWTEAGLTEKRRLWFDPATCRQVSQKAGSRGPRAGNRTAAQMRALGYIQGPVTQKRRFVFPLWGK